MNNLVGRCGLYCGACTIYRAERDSPEMRQQLAEHFECEPEEVHCNGCHDLTPECWGYNCKFVVCLREKGYEFCSECPEYENQSCEEFEKFSQGYQKEGVDLRENLAMIKSNVNQWLTYSQELYTCTTCGGPLIAGSDTCHHCGEVQSDAIE